MTERADGQPLWRFFDIVRTPFIAILTIPSAIAIGLGLLGLACGWLDRAFPALLGDSLSAQAAQSVLQAVATAAMAALSLTYSLMLVVYTLAAGNIGPRLLKRFTTETINQMTAGILGGTFLFALAALLLARDDQAPAISVLAALVLSAGSVLQLIAFVRKVSRHVTIDDEIAAIGRNLEDALQERLKRRDGVMDLANCQSLSSDCRFEPVLKAQQSGYLGATDITALVKKARDSGSVFRLENKPGEFTQKDEVLLCAHNPGDNVKDLGRLVVVSDSRSIDRPVEFQTNLLVEIALRALSPGVNDVFTAVAATNQLVAALVSVADVDLEATVHLDENGEARLVTPGMKLGTTLSRALHPLRRVAGDHILMAEALAKGYASLYDAGGAAMREEIAEHVGMLLEELERAGHLAQDIRQVQATLPEPLLAAATEPGRDRRT